MTDKPINLLLIIFIIYPMLSLHFSEGPDIKSIDVKKSVFISLRHYSTALLLLLLLLLILLTQSKFEVLVD